MNYNSDRIKRKKEKIKSSIQKRVKKFELSSEVKNLALEIELSRIEMGLTQNELAQRAGIHINTYKKLIGVNYVEEHLKAETLAKVEKALGKDENALYYILYPEEKEFVTEFLWKVDNTHLIFEYKEGENGRTVISYSKSSICRAKENNVSCYMHIFNLNKGLEKKDIYVSPGKLESIVRVPMHWVIQQKFNKVYNKGDVEKITYGFNFYNSKNDKAHDLSLKVFPSMERISLDLYFPKSLNCKRFLVSSITAMVGIRTENDNISYHKLGDGRTKVVWFKENPGCSKIYVLHWEW